MNLRISEIFCSIQGEGIWAGKASVFVRVSGCNLRCRWCDTPYASWHPEGPLMSLEEIEAKIESYVVKDVVLTGGEPMLFEAVVPLTKSLKAKGHTITIETAGTVDQDVACDLMSISPKLADSTPSGAEAARHEAGRWRPDVLTSLMGRYEFQLKFVVGEQVEQDVREIENCLTQLPAVSPDRILLMPEGTESGLLWSRTKALVPVCIERGWRLAPRMHIDLFGNTRGT